MSHTQAMAMAPVKYMSPGGKDYTLNLVAGDEEMEFAFYQYEAAKKRAKFLAERDKDKNEDELLGRVEHDFVAGHFAILSPDGCRWLVSGPGRMALFMICAKCSIEEARMECLAYPKEVGEALDKVMSHSFPGLEKRWEGAQKKKAEKKEEAPTGQPQLTT